MKALIYDPYLDTLGGGERYCLTVAEYLLKQGWQVDLFWDRQQEIKKAIRRFDLRIENVGLIGKKPEELSLWQRWRLEREYDLIFWLSDGSIPFLFANKNFIHFQVPFKNIRPKNLFAKVLMKTKLSFINQVVCNSRFTKKIIDQQLGVKSLILYPPVDVEKFQPGKKENIILAVGRFEETMQAKRQDVLIKAFKKMVNQGLTGWQLVLAGGSLAKEENNKFLQKLKKQAKGYPIKFKVNLSFEELKKLYQRAAIFWHAAGFGINEKRNPEKVEHFGITTVEAMAAGCVPVVINKGGLREIVRRGVGERWNNPEDLVKKTLDLIKNPQKRQILSQKAQKQAWQFSKKRFYKAMEKLIGCK